MQTETMERLCKVYEHGWRLFLVDNIAIPRYMIVCAVRHASCRLLACLWTLWERNPIIETHHSCRIWFIHI